MANPDNADNTDTELPKLTEQHTFRVTEDASARMTACAKADVRNLNNWMNAFLDRYLPKEEKRLKIKPKPVTRTGPGPHKH